MIVVTSFFTSLLHGTFRKQSETSYIVKKVTSKMDTNKNKNIFTFNHARILKLLIYLHIICNYCNNISIDTVFVCNFSCNNHVTDVTTPVIPHEPPQ